MQSLPPCPRCRGKQLIEKDGYGAFINCLMCGRYRDYGKIVSADRKYSPREPVFRTTPDVKYLTAR